MQPASFRRDALAISYAVNVCRLNRTIYQVITAIRTVFEIRRQIFLFTRVHFDHFTCNYICFVMTVGVILFHKGLEICLHQEVLAPTPCRTYRSYRLACFEKRSKAKQKLKSKYI